MGASHSRRCLPSCRLHGGNAKRLSGRRSVRRRPGGRCEGASLSVDLAHLLKELAANVDNVPPCTSLYMNHDGDCIELYTDTHASTYSEWINGEGGDIGLVREDETNKVVGIRLPMRRKRLVVGDSRFSEPLLTLEEV